MSDLGPLVPPTQQATAPSRIRIAASAARRGVVALALTAACAEAFAFAIYVFAGRPFHAWSFAKIGWLYVLSFSRVGLEVRLGSPLTSLGGSGLAGPYRIYVAFLSGTVLAGWLLFRAGRAAATAASARAPASGALIGALVAPGYAVPCWLLALPATVRFPSLGVESIRPVAWEALVFPAVMAATVGAVGGMAAVREPIRQRGTWGPRVEAWACGGWRMVIALVELALVGLLLIGALHPAGMRIYIRWHQDAGRGGATALVHEAFVLPDAGVWIGAASMGGCVVAGARDEKVLCPDRVVNVPSLSHLTYRTDPLPWGSAALLAIPLIATLLGGALAARGTSSLPERVLRGAGAGIVFGALAGIVVWLAQVRIEAATNISRVGPKPIVTAGLALAWGVVGGTLGALLPIGGGREAPEPQEEGGELIPVEPDAPLPPSPTSV